MWKKNKSKYIKFNKFFFLVKYSFEFCCVKINVLKNNSIKATRNYTLTITLSLNSFNSQNIIFSIDYIKDIIKWNNLITNQ